MQQDLFQLPLPFQHQPRFDANDFIRACSNQAALAWLETDWPERRLALFGPNGCGKSHLLHIWARQTGAILLSGQTLTDLDGVPHDGPLALDDADMVRDETLLFHFLNTAADRHLRVLLSGRTAPARWPVHLPDLSSRLRAITVVEVGQPDDDLLEALLIKLMADRQLMISQAVQKWLLLRLPRSPAVLREAVTRLDQEGLVSGMAITRQLAARVLNEFSVVESQESSASGVAPSSLAHRFL
jgi:chromosomal replication initiation ATPase DnaA